MTFNEVFDIYCDFPEREFYKVRRMELRDIAKAERYKKRGFKFERCRRSLMYTCRRLVKHRKMRIR